MISGLSDRGRALFGGVLAFALVLLVALPSWTRDPGETIRFMIWGAPEEISVVQGFLTEFEREHPDVRVRVEAAPSMGYTEKLRIQFIGDNPPDVMYLGQDSVEDFASRGWLADLQPLVDRDRSEVDPDDFYEGPYDRFRYQDGLYGISKDFATLVLYYNKDLFDKWGVEYPQPGWSTEDFLAKAKALSQGGDYGFLLETWPEELYPWIYMHGGAVAQEQPQPEWQMGKPDHIDGSVAGLQFLRDLIWKHKVAPGPSVTRDQGGNALFLRGQVGMCTYGRWACMQFRNVKSFDWGCIELPHHEGRRATSGFAVSYAMAARTKQPEKSWKLIKFLTNRANQERVGHSAQAIPARRSAAESPAFLSPDAFSHLPFKVASEPHTAAASYAHFSPRFRGAPKATNEFREAMEPLWNGTKSDPRPILEKIQPRIDEILRDAQAHDH